MEEVSTLISSLILMARDWQDLFIVDDGAVAVAAEDAGRPVGCGGVRTLAPGLGEVKRMYVAPHARRRGIARRILGELERIARELGHTRVRLDTNAVQPEAVALYHACGYTEIADYNGNPFATHWFEKRLD